ncbi:MAG: substrate-binding domain-containing protein [bacterium]|nr:substrate-binding domain-containing protein [bacterium]
MKRNLVFLLITVMLFSILTGCRGDIPKKRTIAVVAKGESHAFWQSVKSGAEAAGEKYGYNVTFRGPASESAKDLPSQLEMVQTAISNGSSAIVLGTIGEGFVGVLSQAKASGIPVVEFDSGVWDKDIEQLNNTNKNPIVSSVATSNYSAAGLAAEHFFRAIKNDIAARDRFVIGVIQHDETQTGIDRAAGFINKFKELADQDQLLKDRYVIEHEIKPGDAGNVYKTALEALAEKQANAIFMTNEGVVKQVYDAIASSGGKYDSIKFCGYDAGTKQIEWMKKTTGASLVGSVAQDSYQIGYKAVEQAVMALEGKEVEKRVDISGAWWDAGNVDEMIDRNLVYKG